MARVLACVAVLALPCIVMGQGKLDRVREEVDRPRESNDNTKNQEDSNTPLIQPDEEAEDDGFQQIFLYAAIYPWAMSHAMFDPGFKVDAAFTPYPYATRDTAHIQLDRTGRPDDFDNTATNWYSVRASGEIGHDFDGLTRTGLRLFLDTDTRFGIKTDCDYYIERLSCGCRDALWIGDVTATFRFAQNEWIQMHSGLGARFLLDDERNRGGVNFLYGLDYFPVEPAHVFGSFEAGTLGSAVLYRLHGGVGASWTHGEVFIGYDYLQIGSATLQGPFVGLRLWF